MCPLLASYPGSYLQKEPGYETNLYRGNKIMFSYSKSVSKSLPLCHYSFWYGKFQVEHLMILPLYWLCNKHFQGMDKDNVCIVVRYELPPSLLESYQVKTIDNVIMTLNSSWNIMGHLSCMVYWLNVRVQPQSSCLNVFAGHLIPCMVLFRYSILLVCVCWLPVGCHEDFHPLPFLSGFIPKQELHGDHICLWCQK